MCDLVVNKFKVRIIFGESKGISEGFGKINFVIFCKYDVLKIRGGVVKALCIVASADEYCGGERITKCAVFADYGDRYSIRIRRLSCFGIDDVMISNTAFCEVALVCTRGYNLALFGAQGGKKVCGIGRFDADAPLFSRGFCTDGADVTAKRNNP